MKMSWARRLKAAFPRVAELSSDEDADAWIAELNRLLPAPTCDAEMGEAVDRLMGLAADDPRFMADFRVMMRMVLRVRTDKLLAAQHVEQQERILGVKLRMGAAESHGDRWAMVCGAAKLDRGELMRWAAQKWPDWEAWVAGERARSAESFRRMTAEAFGEK